MYTPQDEARFFDESASKANHSYRTAYRRDIDRLIHSTCFRRLQGKTQLYPGFESDFFRNRLTHSLEVAQIARSIAAKLNSEEDFLKQNGDYKIDLDIVEFAGLAHDLGHPPFGHQGEHELDRLMISEGGYEGNAQTLRLLTKIEKKGFSLGDNSGINGIDNRRGLNLTMRTLASILKYDAIIPYDRKKQKENNKKPMKAYYSFDQELIGKIKKATGGHDKGNKFKTVECRIMDLADDISYSTYDLEDGLKAGFYTLQDVVYAPYALREKIAAEIKINLNDEDDEEKKWYEPTPEQVGFILQNMFKPFLFPEFQTIEKIDQADALPLLNKQYELAKDYSSNGYLRNHLTSQLVNKFVEGVRFTPNKKYPAQSKVYLDIEIRVEVEVLKKFTYIYQVLSPRLKVAEFRGREIVFEIFTALTAKGKNGFELLPDDYRHSYETAGADKKRIICDYIAGMTDRYAIEFYARLKSENAETIFKPL
jgi:dGTPase